MDTGELICIREGGLPYYIQCEHWGWGEKLLCDVKLGTRSEQGGGRGEQEGEEVFRERERKKGG